MNLCSSAIAGPSCLLHHQWNPRPLTSSPIIPSSVCLKVRPLLKHATTQQQNLGVLSPDDVSADDPVVETLGGVGADAEAVNGDGLKGGAMDVAVSDKEGARSGKVKKRKEKEVEDESSGDRFEIRNGREVGFVS